MIEAAFGLMVQTQPTQYATSWENLEKTIEKERMWVKQGFLRYSIVLVSNKVVWSAYWDDLAGYTERRFK